MIFVGMRARVILARFSYLLLGILLVGCQPAQATPPAGVLWVDASREIGAISPYVLGVNHGLWSSPGVETLDEAKSLGFTFLRWPGGAWGDLNDVKEYQVDQYIAFARETGAEPSIVVRMPRSSPEKAAELVRYVNIEKKYGVKYWAIGNEPTLYAGDLRLVTEGVASWTPQSYAKRWREYAVAMEAVDPSILFYGPEVHGTYIGDPTQIPWEGETREYVIEFLKVNGDMVDVVTIHQYPFPICSTCGNPTWDELRENTVVWDRLLPNLRRMTRETIGKELPVGITEYNSNYTNVSGTETSPDSFLGALWLADVYGRMVRTQPEMLAYWYLGAKSGHGVVSSFEIRPAYYVFQMYSHFGNHLLPANSDQTYVSIFAAKTDDGAVTVMLVNLNAEAVTLPLQLHGGNNLSVSEAYIFDATHNAEAFDLPGFENGSDITLPVNSATLLIFR